MSNKFQPIIAECVDIARIYDEKIKENPCNQYLHEHKINRMCDTANGTQLCFYGFLNNVLVCEAVATVSLSNKHTQNIDKIMTSSSAYLSAFETKESFRGLGYFSALYKFMEIKLKNMGFKYLVLGVEPNELKNKAIYQKWGYTELIYIGTEEFDGLHVDVEYYRKKL